MAAAIAPAMLSNCCPLPDPSDCLPCRRGYRQAMHRASLNEAAAAGLLHMAGWDRLCREEGAGARAWQGMRGHLHAVPHLSCPVKKVVYPSLSPTRPHDSA